MYRVRWERRALETLASLWNQAETQLRAEIANESAKGHFPSRFRVSVIESYCFSRLSVTKMHLVSARAANSLGRSVRPGSLMHSLSVSPSTA